MPTETQYSLSVRADDVQAMSKIGRIKKRDMKSKPALFVKDMDMAEKFCEINDKARKLAEKYLPGPLTMVLPAKNDQHFVSTDFLSDDGFGIRISSSPLIRMLMDRLAFAVTATSANISGELTHDSVEKIAGVFGDMVDLYIDGGPCRGIVPSTVLKVTDDLSVLRHGLISEAEINRFMSLGE
jgi:L-threonylcarbamoyladenylate synthase